MTSYPLAYVTFRDASFQGLTVPVQLDPVQGVERCGFVVAGAVAAGAVAAETPRRHLPPKDNVGLEGLEAPDLVLEALAASF
jgi:hypothetical protein